jgi:glutaredoxin 3
MLTVYSKPTCPYCDMAKNYLRDNSIAFVEIDVQQDPAALEFIRAEGHRTVPQIYLNGRVFVPGGWQGLSSLTPEQIQQELELRQALDDVDAI